MRRPCAVPRPAALVTLALLAAPMWAAAAPAVADTTDGTLTVVVSRDTDLSGGYDPEIDQPQPGIQVTVTDAGGNSVTGTTDADGRVVVKPTAELTGGRYFVTAEIPAALDLSPVPESETFAPLSSTVDVTSESRTVQLGVVPTQPDPPTPSAPVPPVQAQKAVPAPPALPRFAVGDRVWADLNRDGRQDPGEPAAPRTSVQLLAADGRVLDSTTTGRDGRYRFDGLPAGTYSVRFAGIPAGWRLSPPAVGAAGGNSDPDYTGVTPPFELRADRSRVRAATASDGVGADYVDDTVDAGIARLTYAVASMVWQDADGDGLLDPDEPGGRAHVSLLDHRGQELAGTDADERGRFVFTRLEPGRYRLRFSELGEHRRLTRARVGNNPAIRSAADARTQTTEQFALDASAPDLVPAADVGVAGADFVKVTLNAGTVGSYSITNRVWRDADGDGVAEAGEPGVAGVRVELLDPTDAVVASTVTGRSGRYAFDRLSAGQYRLRFSRLPRGLRFTAPGAGADRSLDSDVYGAAVTSTLTVDDGHPVEDAVAAGLTTSTAAGAVTTPSLSPSPSPSSEVAEVAPDAGGSGGRAHLLAPLGLALLVLVPAAAALLRLRRRS